MNYKKIDCDTYINEYSYENIYYTTGCVFDAKDLVMSEDVKNAFTLIRPHDITRDFMAQWKNQ